MDAMNKKIGIVVLAAGGSSRMKQPKQLLKFQGKTLLRRTVETATESLCDPVVVVLGANSEKTTAEIKELPVEICINENWQTGLSSSIRSGLEKIVKLEPEVSAVIFTLADHPFVESRHINKFVDMFLSLNAPVIAAEYNETTGVPALFSRKLFTELQQLENDKGAKQIIKRHSDLLTTISLPEAAFDIDTPEDLEKLK